MLRACRVLDEKSAVALNRVVLYVALPALSFKQLHGMQLVPELAYAAAMPWLVFAGAWLVMPIIARKHGWSRATTGALILGAGLGNTSFVGFPLLELLYGRSSLKIGIVADQAGSFLAFSTLGVLVAALYSRGRPGAEGALVQPRISASIARVLRFPPFIAMILGAALRPITFPQPLEDALGRLGDLLVPVALISVGLTLKFDRAGSMARVREIAWCLGYKLIVAPAAIMLIYAGLLGLRGEVLAVSVTEAAMAPMITAAILAQEAGLDSELPPLLLGIGIPLSLVTAILWAKGAPHLL